MNMSTEMEQYLHTIVNTWRQYGVPANNEYMIDIENKLQTFEPILTPNPQRFVLFPIQNHEIWQMYKKHESTFWVAEEIDLSKDLDHWYHRMNDNERHFIGHVLAFFASFDGIVNENLTSRFICEIQIPEARAFYGFQIMIENIHSEVYSLLIDTYISDPQEKHKFFHAIDNFPSVKKMADWAMKWTSSNVPFNQRILAYTCIEGIMFSGPFCAIYWLKKRELMPGLTYSNELIARDEGLHMDFGVLIHKCLKYPASIETTKEIVLEAVNLCREFICESLPCALIGMNSDEMSQYIEYVADRLLVKLIGEKMFNAKNPFVGWMELISIPAKTNFFERKVAEYVKSGTNYDIITGTTQSNKSNLLDDF